MTVCPGRIKAISLDCFRSIIVTVPCNSRVFPLATVTVFLLFVLRSTNKDSFLCMCEMLPEFKTHIAMDSLCAKKDQCSLKMIFSRLLLFFSLLPSRVCIFVAILTFGEYSFASKHKDEVCLYFAFVGILEFFIFKKPAIWFCMNSFMAIRAKTILVALPICILLVWF